MTRPQPARTVAPVASRAERGFTIIEMVVALAVLAILLVATLALFDYSSKIARAQTHVSEMQQSLRVAHAEIVRHVRMAGRSWRMEAPVLDPNQMLEVWNNARQPATVVGASGPAAATLRTGTDMLIVRGVFTTPLYKVDPATATINTATVRSVSPEGIPQDLSHLVEATNFNGQLLVINSLGGARLISPSAASGDLDAFTFDLVGISAVPAMVGILEEYRFYVRENVVNGVPQPRLSRARVIPFTNTPYEANQNNLWQDIAEDVLDLQFAFGIDAYATDSDSDGIPDVGDATILETADGTGDEWFMSNSGEGDDYPDLLTDGGGDPYYLRITTLARTHRRDFGYVAPAIDSIEDNVYAEAATPASTAESVNRQHRRRQLTTVVDLRNY